MSNTRIAIRSNNMTTCQNLYDDCSYEVILQYMQANTYLFNGDGKLQSYEVPGEWQLEYPTNDTGVFVTCYYNYCLVNDNNCDARNLPMVMLNNFTVNAGISFFVSVFSFILFIVTLIIWRSCYSSYRSSTKTHVNLEEV